MCKYLSSLMLLLLFGAVAATGWGQTAAPVRAEILQYKLNRLYLGAGSEQLIRPGCPVSVICDGDTLVRTEIAGVLEGVAVTREVAFADSVALENCAAGIIPARLDSSAAVRIGTDLDSLSPAVASLQQALRNNKTGRMIFLSFGQRVDMLMAYDDGQIDAYLSYRSGHADRRGQQVTAVAPPYLAVLLPDPTRPFNQYGELTTSLYYRFNSDNLSALFDGDGLRPVFSFIDTSATRRTFPYDPYRGRQLFQQLHERPKQLTFGIADPALQPLAAYYADLLARDDSRVTISNNLKQADVMIAWFPFDTSGQDRRVLDTLVAALAADTLPGRRVNEDIRLTTQLLQNARAEIDTLRAARLRKEAENTLTDEVGVFPLFRPTLFVTQHGNVIGKLFDRTGTAHPEQLFILRMPTPVEEMTK